MAQKYLVALIGLAYLVLISNAWPLEPEFVETEAERKPLEKLKTMTPDEFRAVIDATIKMNHLTCHNLPHRCGFAPAYERTLQPDDFCMVIIRGYLCDKKTSDADIDALRLHILDYNRDLEDIQHYY